MGKKRVSLKSLLAILGLSLSLTACDGITKEQAVDLAIGVAEIVSEYTETTPAGGYGGTQHEPNEVVAESLSETLPSKTSEVDEIRVDLNDYILEYQYIADDFLIENDEFAIVNDNVPYFTDAEIAEASASKAFELYSPLDDFGRCGVAYAKIGKELMTTEERGSISSVKPTGWQSVKYDIVDGKYLYNRCHLIGFQLTGENANKQNLITGTRYLNVDGMLPFEDAVAEYIKETGNHVLYRVTPVYETTEDGVECLVASGVYMEAFSLEDHGESVQFNVFCFNNQPGVKIQYTTGNSTVD